MSGIAFNVLTDLRIREHYPLVDDDGSISLLYDLERTITIDVPRELRSRITPALEVGDLDEALAEWFTNEDLLTTERREGREEEIGTIAPQVTDVSLDMSGSCNLNCVYCFENDINSRLGRMTDETAMASLDFVFKKTVGSQHIVLHFGSGEPLLRFDLLQKIVAETTQRANASGQQVTYELTTNATLVTPTIARFLRDNPFRVRVSCDGPPHVHDKFRPFRNGQNSYTAVISGLRLLLEYLPNRLTVNSVISGGTRLADVWAWARKNGLRHYNVIKVGAYTGSDVNLREKDLYNFRADLLAVCDDIWGDLDAGRVPIDYQPITKLVRRLMIPEPITRYCGAASSYLGVASNGKIYPCFRHLGLSKYELGDVWRGVNDEKRLQLLSQEMAGVDILPICQDCWARYLCGGGCYADSTVFHQDKLMPQVEHCPYWRTEIELAIRFYQRLLKADPRYCLRLLEISSATILDLLGSD